jgi:integrase
MAKPRRLTAEYINSIPEAPATGGGYTLHPDIGRGSISNLKLRTTSTGAKAWVLSARFPSKPKNPTLRSIGKWPAIKLDEARETAAEWNRLIARGTDPQEQVKTQKREERAKQEALAREEASKRAGTFANAAELFIDKRVSKLRTGKDVARVIRQDLIRRWGKLPVCGVSKTDAIELLEDAEKVQGAHAARRAFTYANVLFGWLLEREDSARPTYGITANPCAGVRPDRFIAKAEPRQRTFTPSEIRLLWRAGEETPYPVGPYLRLLLILGVRRNELADSTWDEFDLKAATWKLSEKRTKNNEARIIPLPSMAVRILESLPRFAGPYTFSSTGGRSPWLDYDAIKRRIDARITALNGGIPIDNWRLHDARRTMRTNLSAIPTISPIVAELMIGHHQQGLLKVYDQHRYTDEMRAGFEAWAARLRAIVEPQPDNVVELRA